MPKIIVIGIVEERYCQPHSPINLVGRCIESQQIQTRLPTPLSLLTKAQFLKLQGTKKPLKARGCESVIVGDELERMFGEGISVKAPIGCSYLINGFVERHTASVDYDNGLNSDLVLFRDMAIISGNERMEIKAFGIA